MPALYDADARRAAAGAVQRGAGAVRRRAVRRETPHGAAKRRAAPRAACHQHTLHDAARRMAPARVARRTRRTTRAGAVQRLPSYGASDRRTTRAPYDAGSRRTAPSAVQRPISSRAGCVVRRTLQAESARRRTTPAKLLTSGGHRSYGIRRERVTEYYQTQLARSYWLVRTALLLRQLTTALLHA